MEWEKELALATRAATEAGARLREDFHSEKSILSEIGRDIKLQADQDAEKHILDLFQTTGYSVLAEESGEHGELNADTLCWVVDPLDGTMNYSRRMPLCCVSIALCRGEEPLLGVIYDFNRDELFTAVVGAGAWVNGVPAQVSTSTDPEKAILTTGFPVSFAYEDQGMADFCGRVRRFKKTRMLGSAALMLAYVGSGRADAYSEDDIMLWDIAAGIALVKAAGGYVNIQPSKKKWARRVRCAANASIWES